VIAGSDPELADAVLAALLIAAGYDGAWHRDRTDARTAAQSLCKFVRAICRIAMASSLISYRTRYRPIRSRRRSGEP